MLFAFRAVVAMRAASKAPVEIFAALRFTTLSVFASIVPAVITLAFKFATALVPRTTASLQALPV
jgi:hypothetical protein